MINRTNKTKTKLLSGLPAFGVSVMIPSPQVVEMLGRLGFDWVLIDCEHGSISLESVELMVVAAEVSDIVPIVRPRTKDAVDIINVMDRGAMGVQVPHVNTAADAQAVVEAVKYHPVGTRGLAAGTRSANYGFGLAMADYVQQANRETLVCVQLEEAQALENIDEIVQVEGVDVFFVGPSDLSQSLGYPGRVNAPEVVTAVNNAFEIIVAAGKVPGSAGSTGSILNYLDRGCLYVFTHLQKLLASATDEFMSAVKSEEANSS